MRRLLVPLLFSTALVDCQSYDFRHITPVSVEVDTLSTTIAASPGTAYIMIVQDISGSMCEPINHDAGLATTGLGANDCAADQEDDSKAGIVAGSMQQVLDKLNPKINAFDMGLFAFPDTAAGDGGNSCGVATDAVFPIDDAQTSIPKIVTWYQTMPNIIGGGTPTAPSLLSAAKDPLLVSPPDPRGRRYVLLITDGLPNCDDKNPCVLDSSAPQYHWTDDAGHGCESPSFQHANAARLGETLNDAGQPFAEPPAECQCSQGSCPDPIGDGGGNIGLQCCVVDPYLLVPGNPSLAVGADQCLDSAGTISAVQQLADAGITTYVIGMGFDYTNPLVLNEIAQAGDPNNSDAGYYQASDPTSLYAAINTIIQNAIPRCDFTLNGALPADPALIQVKLNGMALLLNDSNGFAYDADAGEIDLLGTACSTAKDGDSNQLAVSLVAQP